jgi:Flp pilus assembly protein TadB
MCWLALSPLVLGVLVALAHFVVTLLVARGERRRRLRYAVRVVKGFRPVVIQGGVRAVSAGRPEAAILSVVEAGVDPPPPPRAASRGMTGV